MTACRIARFTRMHGTFSVDVPRLCISHDLKQVRHVLLDLISHSFYQICRCNSHLTGSHSRWVSVACHYTQVGST